MKISKQRLREIIVEEIEKIYEVNRGGMKIGQTYTQKFNNGDTLYFRVTGTTNSGVKGILYQDYVKRVSGKNPKKYTVSDVDMNLWSDISKVPSNIASKLKENIELNEGKLPSGWKRVKQGEYYHPATKFTIKVAPVEMTKAWTVVAGVKGYPETDVTDDWFAKYTDAEKMAEYHIKNDYPKGAKGR